MMFSGYKLPRVKVPLVIRQRGVLTLESSDLENLVGLQGANKLKYRVVKCTKITILDF